MQKPLALIYHDPFLNLWVYKDFFAYVFNYHMKYNQGARDKSNNRHRPEFEAVVTRDADAWAWSQDTDFYHFITCPRLFFSWKRRNSLHCHLGSAVVPKDSRFCRRLLRVCLSIVRSSVGPPSRLKLVLPGLNSALPSLNSAFSGLTFHVPFVRIEPNLLGKSSWTWSRHCVMSSVVL